MSEKYKGYFFNVGNDTTWVRTESFKDALETYYIFKSYSENVKIWDAVTDKIIFG